MKKIVIDGFNEIDYNKAVLIYKPNFVKKHTLVVEDKSKFESLHNIAYKELNSKYEMNEQINKLLNYE